MPERILGNAPERVGVTQRKLEAIARQQRYRNVLGDVRVIPMGNAGFVVERGPVGLRAALFDFDDVTGATTEIKDAPGGVVDGKPTLFARYKAYTRNLGMNLPDDVLRKVIKLTDAFARWEDVAGGGDIYHQGAHASALESVTGELRGKRRSAIEATITSMEHTLARIKTGLTTDYPVREQGDPFRFRRRDRQLIVRGSVPWSQEMGDIFMETMIRPPYYAEILETMDQLRRGENPMDAIAFTKGDPVRQLPKILEMICQRPGLRIPQIWLTQVDKGDFITEMKSLGLLPEGDFVLIDDSDKELRTSMAASDRITGVRSIRPRTKEGMKPLPEAPLPYTVIDFGTGTVRAEDVASTLRTAVATVARRREPVHARFAEAA